MEFIESDLFMYFGEALVLVQDESTDSLVIIISGRSSENNSLTFSISRRPERMYSLSPTDLAM